MKWISVLFVLYAFSIVRAQLTLPVEWQQKDTNLHLRIFRCYISDVHLLYADGSEFSAKEQVFLIDLADSASLQLQFPDAPKSDLSGVRFRLGTDSTLNVAGVYDGALDPLKGMYWAWNTGYINLKIEGHYLQKEIELHIGGYRTPYTTDRELEIKFDAKKAKLVLSPDAFVQFALGQNLSSIMIPGKDASLLANQYHFLFNTH